MRKRREPFIKAKTEILEMLMKKSPRRMNEIRNKITISSNICSLKTLYAALNGLETKEQILKKKKNGNHVEIHLSKVDSKDLSFNLFVLNKKKVREDIWKLANYFGLDPMKTSLNEFMRLLTE